MVRATKTKVVGVALVTMKTLRAEESDKKRTFSLYQIKCYNLVKTAVWNCVMDNESDIPKEEQEVELVLLRDLMKEIQSLIDFYLVRMLSDKKKNKRAVDQITSL